MKAPVLGSLFNNAAGLQAWDFIKKILQHWCFPTKFAKFLRTPILKNICERLFLFVSPQNTFINSGGEFGLEVWTRRDLDRVQSKYFLNVTISFNQMQPYNLYVS